MLFESWSWNYKIARNKKKKGCFPFCAQNALCVEWKSSRFSLVGAHKRISFVCVNVNVNRYQGQIDTFCVTLQVYRVVIQAQSSRTPCSARQQSAFFDRPQRAWRRLFLVLVAAAYNQCSSSCFAIACQRHCGSSLSRL